jgi:Nif11 domain
MAKKRSEKLLIAGGENEVVRMKYDAIKDKGDFVAMAVNVGYDFTRDELNEVLRESGDFFDLVGNQHKRLIWW